MGEMELSVIGAGRGQALDQQSMQHSLSSRMVDPADLTPVNRAQFAAEIGPCLELVAPTGMDEERKRSWLNAAYKALDGIPIGLLKRGAAAALTSADHPAKIVPAIMREIGADWDRRRQLRAPHRPQSDALKCAVVSPAEAKEVGALMSNLARQMRSRTEEDAQV